ncbi:MAG: response regulator [Candidatus Acidiferrales bacterium]
MRDEKPRLIDEAEMRSSTRKVLIVDQDIQDLSFHAMPFEDQGCMVYKCSSYETALRSVEKEDFDLAVVDQGSPAFEGRRVIRHLNRYGPRTPFIVLAKRKDSKCYMQAMELGAVDYLEKPVSTEEMNWVIQNLLGICLKT